ncbi:MAG: hypothetical protein RMH75_06740 [Archaeoglobaceae archaeon]|nr:hypothetical protein [Archaeoglobaceae archaeon]
MKITPPIGKKIRTLYSNSASLVDLSSKIKEKTVLLRIQGESNGWVILSNKKVLAACYSKGDAEIQGLEALVEIDRELKNNCKILVSTLDNKVVSLFLRAFPVVTIGLKVEDAVFESKIREKVDLLHGKMASVEQFTEEFEEGKIGEEIGKEVEKNEEVPKEFNEEKPLKTENFVEEDLEEDPEGTMDKTEDLEIIEPLRVALIDKKLEEKQKEEIIVDKNWIINFQDFLDSLSKKGFTGIVKGVEETMEFTAYLLNGKIVACIVKDNEIELRGNSALLYLDSPAKVIIEEKKPEEIVFPEDAKCGVDEDVKNAFYRTI